MGKCSHSLVIEGNLYAYQNRLQSLVQQAMSVVKACAEDESLGDERARQAEAMKIIKAMRYGPDNTDYLWINDSHPRMVMHPYKPQLDGKDLSESADPDGKKLFVEFAKTCKAKGSGFVTYKWPKPGNDQPVPKISYVALYEPWDWIVGTGVFVTEDDPKFLARLDDFASGRPFSLGVELAPQKNTFNQFLTKLSASHVCEALPEMKQAIEACCTTHGAILANAKSITDAVTACKMDEAMRLYKYELQPAAEELKDHFFSAINVESRLEEGAAKANDIYITQTQPALAKVRKLLTGANKAIAEHMMSDEIMLEAARVAKRNVTALGAVAIVLGVFLAVMISRGIVRALRRIIFGLSEGAEQGE